MKILKSAAAVLAAAVGTALAATMLLWLLSSTGTEAVSTHDSASASIMSKFNMFVNNSTSEALDGIVPIKKVYTLPEDLIVAPEPRAELYGTATSPAELEGVIAEAGKLLDGQETLFNSSIELMKGSSINYYYDETILAITWKQAINSACYTFSEIKLADASQFRRYLADNSFGSAIQYRPSDMAATVNAVVAMSGDFYKFRPMGVVVYRRNVHRAEGEEIDTLFIDSKGDFNFVKRGEIMNQADAESYVAENDILFSLSFGPVLVDKGVKVVPDSYPIGEIHDTYSRAAIAQLGETHYLLVTVNYEGPYVAASTIGQLADVLESMGVDKAYTLDGGQTGELVFRGEPYNYIDFGMERNVSDILWFATAIPSDVEGVLLQ